MDQPAESDQTFYPIADTRRNQQDGRERSSVETVDEPVTITDLNLVQTSLKIDSIPDKAQVFLNGELKGITPLWAEVNRGMHRIRLSLEDHYDWESSLFIEEAGKIPIRIPLLKK